MNILVIAPHPDDEVLGCGGTLKKLSKHGHNIKLIIVTKAYEPDWSKEMIEGRPKKVKAVANLLGISAVEFLDVHTAKTDQLPIKELTKKITETAKTFNPEIVFIPFWGDAHQDHQKVSKASVIAFRPVASGVRELLAYETLSETEWGIEAFKPTVYSNIKAELSTKLEAMKIYDDELKDAPHPRSLEMIEVLAKKRGSEILTDYAEGFICVRKII